MCAVRSWCVVVLMAGVAAAGVGERIVLGEGGEPVAAAAVGQPSRQSGTQASSQPSIQARTQPVDVRFEVGDSGLASLRLGGQEMLGNGRPQIVGAKAIEIRRSGDEIVQSYAWGALRIQYGGNAQRLTIRIVVENTSAEAVDRVRLRVAVLRFPQPPLRQSCDPGMFGTGRGTRSRGIPVSAGRGAQPPVIAIAWPAGTACWCADAIDEQTGVAVDASIDPKTGVLYPLRVSLGSLAAGQRRELTCSLRTAPAAGEAFAPAADVLAAFGRRYPMKLQWDDRRPIGMMNLCGVDPTRTDLEKNPRHWLIINGGKVDVSTPQGRTEFAAHVLKLAENSVKTLREAGAQGVITWDIEGWQHRNCVYYGTPHLAAETAPEMEELVEIEVDEQGGKKTLRMPVVDAYFRKFRDAGLRVGVCLRPQAMRRDAKGAWSQVMLNDEQAYADLKQDLEYARKRWDCTLFYIDSTITCRRDDPSRHDVMAVWVLEKLHAENPDVLILPENQTLRYYAVGAPLDSLSHHGVVNTYGPIRRIWPRAFICTMAHDGATMLGKDHNTPEALARRKAEMIDAAMAGDVFMIAGWYMNSGTKEIMEIQHQAARVGADKPVTSPN